MPRGKPIGPREADQALRLIAEGKTLSEIASIIGLSYTGLHPALTETWPDEYQEAKQRNADTIRNRVRSLAMQDDDLPTARWALDHQIKWHLPEARDTQKIEITGGVKIEHEQRLTLAAVLAAAQSLDGLSASARGLLPAAPPLLPAPDDDQRPAGDLPPRPQP